MTINVTGRSFRVSVGAETTGQVTLPDPIAAGEVIYVAVMCSGGSNANMFPVPLGLEGYNFDFVQGGGGGTEVTIYYYYKVANGDEGGTVVSWPTSSNERIVEAGAIAGCDLRYGPVFSGIGSGGVPPVPGAPNPPSLSPPWGLAEYLWQALAVADDGNSAMAAGPSGYDFSAIRTEAGADTAGITSGYADKVATLASEDPATYTKASSEENAAVTVAWLGLAAPQLRPVAWHSVESVTLATQDITITIPTGEDKRLIVGVSRGAAPTAVTLDPSGLNLSLGLIGDGITTASHSDGGDLTTLWELPAGTLPSPGSYALRVEFAGATQRSVNTLVLQGVDAGAVESVTITINDANMASFTVPTVASSCTLLTYASRTSVVGTTTIPFDQHDLDGYPMVSYGIYYPNVNPARGAVPMVRAGLSPGTHTIELDAQTTSAVVAITLVLKEADSMNAPWWGTEF